mgnify:CR=1 FL=1
MKQPLQTIQDALSESKIEFEDLDKSSLLVSVPGEKKLYTNVIFKVSDKTLSVNAFVIRRPDQNTEKVYEWLLRHNANMYLLSYATNELGDIYLVGRLPLAAVNEVELDRLLGSVMQYADSSFNPLLELGFANAIRREWAWRVNRGESLANLDAFQHLI